jgi:nucleoside-diphosphate-sugar epimerase
MAKPNAMIVGVTGIVGNNLARLMLDSGQWDVCGVSRTAPKGMSQVQSVPVDIRDAEATAKALAGLRPTHVFFCTWSRQESEAANIRVNGGMLRNLLDAILPAGSVRHVALVTGTKHYLGPFEMYAKNRPVTPFREDQPRLDIENFYYVQEDIVFDTARKHGFTWSVHRPHTVVGYAVGNAMNIGTTLAVYATVCQASGRPFVFPGSSVQYAGLTDVTDARLLARHLVWAATTPSAYNEAFNVVNGDVFRWERMWGVIARYFGLDVAPSPETPMPLERQLADAAPIWEAVVREHRLQPNRLNDLASAWHTDSDLGRPVETVNDMSKSRRFGFREYQDSEASFIDLFDRLRDERLIPASRSHRGVTTA